MFAKKALLKMAVVTSAVVASVAGVALAQAQRNDGWGLTVGAGGAYSPSYVGDDDYQLRALPNIRVNYGKFLFASVQDGVGLNLVRAGRFTAGPIAKVRFARNEDGDQPFIVAGDDTTDLVGLGDVATTLELGGFAQYALGPVAVRGEARQGVNGHEGFVFDASANVQGAIPLGLRPVRFSVGPRLRIVNDTYNETYYGVDQQQSLASGLSVYEASGGVQSYGVGGSVFVPFGPTKRFAVGVVGSYDRLTGDAGDSPLVQERGSEDQASVGLVFTYRLK